MCVCHVSVSRCVPVCAESKCRSLIKPSRRCRPLRTPECETYRTSETNANYNTRAIITSQEHIYHLKCQNPRVCVLPQVRSSVHDVKHLSGVQQLFESPQKLHALIISAFTVHENQQRARAGRRTRRLPEPCTQINTHVKKIKSRLLCSMYERSDWPLTVRVDAVEGCGWDHGYFTLTQRALERQLLFTPSMHLENTNTELNAVWVCY